MRSIPIFWTVNVLWLCVPGCAFSSDSQSSKEWSVSALRGERIYNKACAACHSQSGNGSGPAAKYLDPKPRDFTKGAYKFRSTPSGSLPADEDIFRTISRGIPGTSMPAWGDILSEDERMFVIQYIKTFSSKFEKRRPKAPIDIPQEMPVTQETIAQGEKIYMLMQCWKCHGKRGKGDGPSSDNLKDSWGNPIEAYDFTKGEYKGGRANKDIYRVFNTGLSGTPMPSYARSFLFTRESYQDLVTFEGYYSDDEIKGVKDYIKSLITRQERDTMSDEEKTAIEVSRKWSLVHYVQSLTEKKGFFYKLFWEDNEKTKDGDYQGGK